MFIIFILNLNIIYTFSFLVTNRISTNHFKSFSNQLSMSSSNGVVVIGLAGGIAESISCKLLDNKLSVHTFLDRKPYSPILSNAIQSKAPISFYYDKEVDKNVFNQIASNKIVIIVDDVGDSNVRTKISLNGDEINSETFISKFSSLLPSNIASVICASNAETAKNNKKNTFGSIFGNKGIEVYRLWCQQNNKPFSNFQYGSLIGGIPGLEPMPFVGLPLLEPELDPSYVLQSVVCSNSNTNVYASSEVCTRDTLSEVINQSTLRQKQSSNSIATTTADSLIVSIAGPPLKEKDWDKLFTRMQATGDVELLRIEFAQILKLQPFLNWISDTWFPQALIDADAATILSGSRPVRALKDLKSNSVRVIWEDLQPDLTVRSAGSLEIMLIQNTNDGMATTFYPYLSVVRVAKTPLPGENQLVDRLIEAINKNVYKKQFCVALSV